MKSRIYMFIVVLALALGAFPATSSAGENRLTVTDVRRASERVLARVDLEGGVGTVGRCWGKRYFKCWLIVTDPNGDSTHELFGASGKSCRRVRLSGGLTGSVFYQNGCA